MRIFFLIGSLTVGATLVVGLFQLPVVARVALLVVAILLLVYMRSARARSGQTATRVAYIVHNESERYSGSDVAEFFEALSKAKENTTTPFYGESKRFP